MLSSLPSSEWLSAPMLLRLQRLAGNHAVGELLAHASPAAVQRVTLGWKDADKDSWNAGEVTVTAKGGKAAAGEAGVVRIPVSGIAAGHRGPVKSEMGGGSDPNFDPEAKKKSVAVSTVTNEAVGDESGGRAIVIVPQGLPPGKVDILFHVHGHTIGYRQAKHKKGAAPPPRDVQYDRIEQQLLAASGEGLPMVGILPQGAFYSEFGPGGQAGLNADKYIDEVFNLGVSELSRLKPGRVTLSGWSGAGLGITQMIGGSQAAAGGKKVPGGKYGSLLPTADFDGLFLFDAIYGSWLGPIWDFLDGRLRAELAHLVGLGGGGADPARVAALQEAYLTSEGFRFRGIYTMKGGCKKNYEELRDKHLDKEWFGSAAVVALPETVRERWKANYEVKYSGAGVAHNVMIGKQGGPDQENLLKAIEMLPRKTPSTAAHGRVVPEPAAARRPPQQMAAPRRQQPSPSASTVGSPNDLLIEAAVALGRAGKGSARPEGGTLLHAEDVRAALMNRTKNKPLSERFGEAVARVTAVPEGAVRITAAQREAAALVRVVEVQFILDPTRSALDLLPPDRTKHWRDFKWEKYDYPGGPKGAHEAEAKRMTAEMTQVRPERRPNIGSHAVMVESQATPERWAYIAKHSPQVKGESGARLFEEAGDSFVKMREAAKSDGVTLRILDGFRPHQRAEANAKKADNPTAVARFSSHSLGLAMDMEMSAGSQQFLEIQTRPMQNVADMRAAPAHKWMVLRGEEFGWYPFGYEPWHWEYNPPGLNDRFFSAAPPGVKPAAAEESAKAAHADKPAAAAKAAPSHDRLSGAHWTKQFPGSSKVDTLINPFRDNVITFMGMLHSNKAGVNVAATYRPPERAWLMHWAWYIAKGKISYSKIGTIPNPYKIDIVWNQGDKKSTVRAAQAMVDAYKMKHKAALASRHTEGRAIDMNISRLPQILKIDGKDYPIGTADATENEALWFISDHKFAVKKLASDPPHWSDDGW